MAGFWGRLFGSSEVVKEGVSMIRDAGDALFYTDEEKAADAATERTEARKMIIDWMANTSGQNLARRLLAVMITFVWLFMYVFSMAMNLVAVWAGNPDQWRLSATIIGGYAEQMNGAMMLILAFYFSAPYMGAIVGKAMDKFGGSKAGS